MMQVEQKPVDLILDMMEQQQVAYVDLRFTDFRGKEQHITVPVSAADKDFFAEGKMFDGSSLAVGKISHRQTWCWCQIWKQRASIHFIHQKHGNYL